VVDTNIFVSAFLSPKGLATQIMTLALQGKLQVCYNQAIIEEYDEVLSRPNFKFKLTQEQIAEELETLRKEGLFFDVQPSIFPMEDETDRVFYDVAKSASAFLITNNKKHYPKDPIIFTPRDFFETFVPDVESNWSGLPDKTDLNLARQFLRRHSGR
jgi:putative PIN family toxin of toxin-antitoxin system